ncbi:MarR family winged helix-turn-helix transcriptional regulator [Nocardia sp. NBC_01730]|uniref:MarR family winged helix-turn-helix transcriptional regulator n=1 Tax=Nocardia sp. NBC_01730 TaxID=2975998 RepID=UPI002E117011|nr:MarR family winged helix-turn-helix transcriptional regulator [Nocardia sp. NBC_01730]
MSKLVRNGVDLLAWIATLTGAAGVALHFSQSWWRMLVLAASGAPYLMSCALVGVVAFVAMRHWSGAGVAIVVVTIAMWTQAPLYFSRSGDDGHAVIAMQANLLFDGADPRALVDQVRARNIALLTGQRAPPVIGEDFRDPLTTREIGRRSLITAGAVSQRVARAERAGLVERSSSSVSRRAVAVRLTEIGHRLIETTVRQLLEHEADLISALTAAECTALAGILATLEQALVASPPNEPRE